MGMYISKLLDGVLNGFKKESRILMLGLDAAGKTTILYRLKLGDKVESIPTIGFNVEHVEYKNIDMTMWDVGGQTKLRHLWHHYYEGSNALIYVVDSADVDRIDEAREELTGVLDSESFPKDAALVVFANKQDLPGALAPSDIAERMGLPEMRDRKWYVQGSCAANGDGLFEGLDWLATTVNEAQA